MPCGVLERTGLPPAGDATVDETRVAPKALFGAQAEALRHAGPESLDQGVGTLDQPQDHCNGVGCLEIERNRLPASPQQVIAQRPLQAKFDRFLSLDAQDGGTHLGQQHRAHRAGPQARKLDDLDSGERSHAVLSALPGSDNFGELDAVISSLLEHLAGMLAKGRGRPSHAARRAREVHGNRGGNHRSGSRVHVVVEEPGRHQIRIARQLRERARRSVGHVRRVESLPPLRGRALLHLLGDDGVQLREMPRSAPKRREAFVLRNLGPAKPRKETLPLLVARRHEAEVPVLRGEGPAIGHQRPLVAEASLRLVERARPEVLDEVEREHRLEHRHLHLLPFPLRARCTSAMPIEEAST